MVFKTQPPGRAGRGAARVLLPAIDRHQVHQRHSGLTPRVSASEFRVSVRAEPARLNTAIASPFMLGASCFALGAIPAYVHAVGANADAMTFFVGSIFFTSASYCQLVQAQSPGMTGVDEQRQHTRIQVLLWAWRPRDKNWLQPRSSPGRSSSTSARLRRPYTTSPRQRPTSTSGALICSALYCFSCPARTRFRPWESGSGVRSCESRPGRSRGSTC
jgi:hypothetical protein